MEHTILIVDDDKIFNSLLSDVFKQAGYDVHSAESADNALEMLKTIKVDLIVTDQRMPGTTGTQFVHKLLGTHKGLPVVIVSGFLNNDDIRQLIEDGIGGVFIKPLNIFQLLKRASQLIEKRELQIKSQTAGAEQKNAGSNGTPQVFRGATSQAAVKFLKQLDALRSFTSNLVITGGEGTDFETICQDISSSNDDTTFAVAPEETDDPVKLSARLCGLATKDDGRITVVLDDIEALTQPRTETILALSRGKPPFDKLGTHVRFIFCLKSNLDALLDAGRINENLYLFMGTTELKVPSLDDLKDDIPTIAQSMLERTGAACRLDEGAAQELKAHHWTGGVRQLAVVLHEAVAATPGNAITLEAVQDALAGGAATKGDGNLRDHLLKARREYADAMLALYGGDKKAAAEGLEIKEETLAKIVSEK